MTEAPPEFSQLRYFFYLESPSLSSRGFTGYRQQHEPDKMLQSWDLSAPVPMSENMLSSAEQTQLLLYDILIPLLGSLIIVLNVAVVTSSLLLLRKGQQPYTTYLFLGNVAASDLLTGFAVLYGQYAPREIRGEDNCAILIGLIVSTTIVSVYSIGLIAIDRYLYIVYGLQYQRYITPSRAKLSIAATWMIGLIIGFLPAFGWRGDTDGGRVCWFVRLAPPALIILTTVVGIIPLIVVIVLYSIILHKALRRVAQLKKASREQQGALAGNLRLFRGGAAAAAAAAAAAEQPLAEEQNKPTKCFRCCKKRTPKTIDSRESGRHLTKWKAIKVVMLTTGCFVVTWLPYFIASTIFVFCDPKTNQDLCRGLQFAIASPLAILGFTNSLLNPLIYAWWHRGFRTSMQKLCKKMCSCCCQRDGDKSSTQDPAQEMSARTTSSSSNHATTAVATAATVVVFDGNDASQQSRSSDATTSTTTTNSSFTASPQQFRNSRSNGSRSKKPTYRSDTSDLENRITDTDIDRRHQQTRL